MADVDQFDIAVVTPGTKVSVSATNLVVSAFEVVAWASNQGGMSFGKLSVSRTRGLGLRAGDSKTYPPRKGGYNLRYYYVDGDNAAEGVTVIPW